MRVALIDPSLFTLPYDVALAAGLRGEGHEVLLYGRKPRSDENNATAQVTLVPAFYRFAGGRAIEAMPGPARLVVKGADHIASMLGLRQRLRKHPVEVIHFQWLPLPFVDRHFLAGLRRSAPLVLTVHDTKPFNGDPTSGLQGLGALSSFRLFERLIVHTLSGRERLVEHGVDSSRISVIPHGLLGDGHSSVAADDFRQPVLTFLVFGKIKPYKGVDLLIEAFARIPPDLRSSARIRVVGKPYMDVAPLLSLAAELGVDLQLEPRFVADDEVPALFGPGTIATFPYREIEASGVLTLAMANRRPILASRIGGFAEAIADGVHGALVDPADPAALAVGMTRFLQDRDFAAACARNVAELASAMPDWSEIARRTTEIYSLARAD